MAGTLVPTSRGNIHAALWRALSSAPEDLGALKGYEQQCFGLDLDEGLSGRLRVVGYWHGYDPRKPYQWWRHAFLWRDGVGMKDLNSMADVSASWVL